MKEILFVLHPVILIWRSSRTSTSGAEWMDPSGWWEYLVEIATVCLCKTEILSISGNPKPSPPLLSNKKPHNEAGVRLSRRPRTFGPPPAAAYLWDLTCSDLYQREINDRGRSELQLYTTPASLRASPGTASKTVQPFSFFLHHQFNQLLFYIWGSVWGS